MKTRIVATLVALLFTTFSQLDAQDTSFAGKTVRLPISEFSLVSQPRLIWLHDQIEKAKADGAAALVLEIDCAGGLAWETRGLVRQLTSLGVPTIAEIKGQAAGPAAFIALACDTISLSPGKKLGGKIAEIAWRGPVSNLPQKLVDKEWDDALPEILIALAPKALDENILRGFVDTEPEITIDGELIDGSSDYTVLTLAEAQKVIPFIKANAQSAAPAVSPEFTVDDSIASIEAESPAPVTTEEEEEDAEIEEEKFGQTKLESYKDKIVIIEVGDETLARPTKFEFMQRVIKKASADGAEAIILDMDTPGGLAWNTVDIMMDAFARVEVPTYTFINTKAMSAGSLIAVATDTVYIHRPGTVGAAGVVSSAGDLPETMKEKYTRFVMAAARGTAHGKGHAKDVAMAFIDPEIEVTRDLPTVSTNGSLNLFIRKVICPKGEMLVLDADQAVERFDGMPVLAKDFAKSVDDIIEKEGLKGEKIIARPMGFESVADWIVKLAPFLMLLGLAGAYMEMKTPGFGVPGTISLICFGLFFFGHSLAGKLAGFELFGLLLIGIIFIALEIFVFPGLFIFGAIGTLMVVVSLIFAMADKYDFQFEKSPDGSGGFSFGALINALETPILNMAIAAAGAMILGVILLRYLPESKAMKWMILETPASSGSAIPQSGATSSLVGESGEAITDLRPAGKGNVSSNGVLDLITSGEFIAKGSRIRVTEHLGSRIVVEKI